MKKLLAVLCALAILVTFGVFALGSSEEEDTVVDQGSSAIDDTTNETVPEDPTAIGDYQVDIRSFRLAKDYEGKDVIIVTYGFTNVKHDDAVSFSVAIEDTVFQNDIGLNKSYVIDDSYDYSEDNQIKEIKAGASLDIEVAYELNDTTSDVIVEVSEWFSLNDKTLTKTFTIA